MGLFLVVIGILIALQINNQNEVKRERVKEISYLKNLQVDLENELKNCKEFSEIHFNRAKASSKVLNLKPPTTIEDVEQYTNLYETVFIWYDFSPTTIRFKSC